MTWAVVLTICQSGDVCPEERKSPHLQKGSGDKPNESH